MFYRDIRIKSVVLVQLIIPSFYFFVILKNFIKVDNFLLANLVTFCFVTLGMATLILMGLKLKKHNVIFIFIACLFVFSQILSFLSSNFRLQDGLLSFQYLGLALIPVFYKLNYKLYKIINYIIVCFFLFQIISDVSPDVIFSVSRNFISVVLIIASSYHFLSSDQNDKKPSILLLFISLFISIWSMARSGMIVYAMLLILYPFMVNYKSHYKIIYLVLLASFLLLMFNYFAETLFKASINKLESGGLEDVRSSMNIDYLNATLNSPLYVLIGTPLTTIKSMIEVELNPHNSFIRLHLYYGLFGFLLVVSTICNALLKYYTTKKYVLLVLFTAILFRSAVDSTSFHGPFDPIIFSLIFFPLKNLNLKA